MQRPVVLIVLSLALVLAQVADAQNKPGKLRSVVVQLDDTSTVVKGRLVSLNVDTVTVLVKDHKTSLPLNRVLRITVRHRDSVGNGALIGALIGGVLCALNCGQGLEHAGELPLAVASSAGTWGAAGAGIDALNRREEVIYERRRVRP
jgi:hypothetical protein